ncbi:MAG: TPM domain-containing protein [Lachnospiraceae bacterium]|nr:TPM domain-containing protein [Lachnospiraceae bacterium]
MIKTQKHNIHKRTFPFFLLLMILTTLLSFSSIAIATTNTDENITRIYDYAYTLSNSEKEDLEELAESYYQKSGNNYLIVTTKTRDEYDYSHSSFPEEDCELYSEAFYKSFLEMYGNSYSNCTILTIDLSSNRYADISGQNDLKTKLDDGRRTKILKKIKSNLSNKDYVKAYTKYIKTVNRYQKIKPGINPDNIFLKIWFQLLISIITGAIIIGIMIYQSGGKMTANGQTYLNRERSKILRKDDYYIRTHTTRTKRETNSNNDSSGGGCNSGGNDGGGNHSGCHF